MADETRSDIVHNHILPLRLYLTVGAILIFLTGLTVGISFVHLGAFNLVVAMAIAALKASLVALFFMHLKYDNKLYMIVFLGAILFLTIFIVFTMFDTMTRGDIDTVEQHPIQKQAEMYENMKAGSGHGHEGHGEAVMDSTEKQVVDSVKISTSPDSSLAKPDSGH